MDHVGIAFEAGHKSGFQQGSVEMIPFFPLGVAGVFAGKYFGAFAAVGVVSAGVGQEPFFGLVVMLVHQVCSQALHLTPNVIKLFSVRVRAAGTHQLDVRIG